MRQRCYNWGAPSSAGAGRRQASQQTAAQGVKAASGAQGPSCRGQAGWRRQASNSHALQGGTGRNSGLWHLRERCRRPAAGAPPGSQRAGADSDACAYGRVQHYGGPRAGLHLASAARSAQSGALASRPVVWRWAERSKISTLAQEHKQYKSPAVTNLFSGTNAELVQTPALLQSVTVSRLEATRTKT